MKSFLNFIRKNGLYAFINLFGLTVSLAFVLLLAVFVSRQLTTDAFQKNADRIYLYANENFIGSAYYLQKHLLDHFPEVEKATSYLSASGMSGLGELTVAGSSTAVTAQTSYADSSFFDMFSFPLLNGSVEAWKASDRSAVISRSFADAHFPGRDPVGQTLTYNVLGEDEGYTFTIAAVMEDIDHSVIKYCDVMCRADFMTELNKANDEEMSNTGMFDTFIMTWPNSDIQAKIPGIREYLGEVWWAYSENMVDKVFGADKGLILRQIASSYLLLSLIAFVVSVPVSWLLTDAWLSQFSYTAAPWLQWVLILASGVLSCGIAFLTILYQSIVAINTAPVIALRKED